MATSTGAIQNLGWLAWRDPRAWMESMRGARWNALVARENEQIESELRRIAGKEEVEAAVTQFEAAREEGDVARSWRVPVGERTIRIVPHGAAGIEWSWEGARGSQSSVHAGDLAVGPGGLLAYTRDFGHGAESYEVVVQEGRRRWTRRGVGGLGYGPNLACIGHTLFLLEATGPLRYSRLVAIDCKGGGERVVLYEEPPDSIWMLSLVKGERGCLWLVAEHAGAQRLFVVEGAGSVRQVCPEGACFVPIGYVAAGTKEPSYLVRRGSLHAPWRVEGPLRKAWTLPRGLAAQCGVELVVGSLGLIVWKRAGERIFWRAGGGTAAPVRLLCEVQVNPWARWAGRSMEHECVVTVPGATPVRASFAADGGMALDAPLSEYGGRRRTGLATSADGARVRWIMIENANRAPGVSPTGLLVVAYGAYGLPTGLDTSRWKPYLERGWAVGMALVRGGGDDNEEWAEAGRREGKLRGTEDLEACIRAMQEVVGMGAEQTLLFGRSAGGYLVGSAIVRHPRGELFRGAYVEVPYVDVLRTAGNPDLPLTAYEYREFGDPAHRLEDFSFLLRHAPISGLGPDGAPGVTVLCRTSLNDRQVYAYESAKWVDALRGERRRVGGARPKWLAFQAGEGHFIGGVQQAIQRAEDFLLVMKNMMV